MKYPNIIFYRHSQYSNLDIFFDTNRDALLCNLHITDDIKLLNKLFDPNYHLLVTFGNSFNEYTEEINCVITERMRKRWLHFSKIEDINSFNHAVNYCYVHNVINNSNNLEFSIFTTCYFSYEKIKRAYESVLQQTMRDWEWVILDDTPDDAHFQFLKEVFKNDSRIRLFKSSENNGSIGNVKNTAVSLCRGKYVIELDHDDEILPSVLSDSVNVFQSHPDVGFIYMDYTNIYENGSNYKYSDCFSLGYAGYYMQWYKGRWIYVASTPNINNITLSNIVAVPNHPRIWRKESLLKMGNYSEMLPISDDYELLLRTAVNTKMVKIHKLGYVQYMNDGGNNFSLIRNSEINRLCRSYLKPMCFDMYHISEYMKQHDAYSEHDDDRNCVSIWKRRNFVPKYINQVLNAGYKKQYAIIGSKALEHHLDRIKTLYTDESNDFLVLDNQLSHGELCSMLESNELVRMKCYSLTNTTIEELVNYFMLIYKSCDEYELLCIDPAMCPAGPIV